MTREVQPPGSSRSRRHPRDFVNTVARALAVISCFGERSRELTLSEVARRAGLTRATSRRVLRTLTDLGYASFDGRLYALTPRVLALGYRYVSSLSFADAAQPFVEDVSRIAQVSASLAVLSGSEVARVCGVSRSDLVSAARQPASGTATGRVLLAQLPEALLQARIDALVRTSAALRVAPLLEILAEVRERGYAIVEDELGDPVRSVAVPVRDARGDVVAALGACGPRALLAGDAPLRGILPVLSRAAEGIQQMLRQGGPSWEPQPRRFGEA